MHKVFTLLLIGGLVFTSQAQNSTSMVTNRPGYTEASQAVFKKGLQFEMGLQYANEPRWKNSADYASYFTVPNLGVLYGLTENVEIRAFGVVTREYYSWDQTSSTSFSDFSLGSKINLTNQKGWLPQMAFLVYQTLPVSQPNNPKIYTTGGTLAWSYATQTRWSVAGNLGYAIDWTTTKHKLPSPHYFNYTLNLGYSWKDDRGVFAELSSFNNLENGAAFYQDVEAGGWYRFTPKFQVDMHAGYTSQNHGYYMEVGGSLLLLK